MAVGPTPVPVQAPPAMVLLDRLTPDDCRVKIGKELFTRGGPVFVEQVVARGFDVFLDLKLPEIPNTVAAACAAAADLGESGVESTAAREHLPGLGHGVFQDLLGTGGIRKLP